MQSTSSVSQGSFLFLPDGFALSKLRKSRKRKLDDLSSYKWEKAFNNIWNAVNQEIKEINEHVFSRVLKDIIEHLKKLRDDIKLNEEVIPCEILLTGTNLPDHKLLLSKFIHDVNEYITPYVASLWSWNCGNIKNTVHNFVSQIIPVNRSIKKNVDEETEGDSDDDYEDEEMSSDAGSRDCFAENGTNKKGSFDIYLQRSQYNFSTLSSWYTSQCNSGEFDKKRPIVIVIPDFESFIPTVLGEFILLLSAYSTQVPFILVFGVATTPIAVYQNLPRKVLSQLVIQLFSSEPSTSLLNNIIENVLFSERCPFRLGSLCMTFLTDIFLFHSFSVHGFIQGFKYCLMEHFYKRDHFILCCSLDHLLDEAKHLSEEDLESIRKLKSFQKHVENSSKADRKELLLDNEKTIETAVRMVRDLLNNSRNFHIALKVLHILTSDLPKNPLGRNLREYYCKCISNKVYESEEYKECMKLLEVQSRNEFTNKINNLLQLFTSIDLNNERNKKWFDFHKNLEEYKKLFENMEDTSAINQKESNENEFETLRKKFLVEVEEDIIKTVLLPQTDLPLHEIIYFDDLSSIRRRISGTPRGSIHLALNNPNCYLKCKCCVSESSDTILPTLPDLSIAYKIHLEYNKMINMYDWLQSFAAIIKQDTSTEVNQEIQARFTRAVSELQFLGFVKPSRAKTDHVSRLTWGNC